MHYQRYREEWSILSRPYRRNLAPAAWLGRSSVEGPAQRNLRIMRRLLISAIAWAARQDLVRLGFFALAHGKAVSAMFRGPVLRLRRRLPGSGNLVRRQMR